MARRAVRFSPLTAAPQTVLAMAREGVDRRPRSMKVKDVFVNGGQRLAPHLEDETTGPTEGHVTTGPAEGHVTTAGHVTIDRPSSVILEDKEDSSVQAQVTDTQQEVVTNGGLPVLTTNGGLPVLAEEEESGGVGPACSADQEDRQGSRWSISVMRKRFREVQIEELYVRYWLRLQRVLLFKLLVVIAIYGVIVLILYNVPRRKTVIEQFTKTDQFTKQARAFSRLWVNVALCIALAVAAMCMILVLLRDVFFKYYRLIAVLVWLFLLALLYAFSPLNADMSMLTPMDSVPMTFYSIFVIHTMLPAPRRYAFLLGLLTGLVDIVVVSVLYKPESLEWKLRPLFANVVIYLCANLTGLYHKHLTDLAHRHTFWDSRKYIEADIRYSRQREKQMRMKEALLLKVIPRHLLEDMKKITYKKIAEMGRAEEEKRNRFYNLYVDRHDEVRACVKPGSFLRGSSKTKVMHINIRPRRKKVFRHLHLQRVEDVSILYADIVNFTPLTEKLGSDVLVEVLNQLFGRFDNLARENQCMRIKMLGDCYYCVSGLPDPVVGHARKSVIMGLQMIHVIRDFRKETGVAGLDMRIGINSGFVLSGVLGLKKWQYDVWSDDVTVANHMESAGAAGKVHITRATLQQLGAEFEVVPAEGASRSDYLKENNVETFFIADSELAKLDMAEVISRINSVKSPPRGGAPRAARGGGGGVARRVSLAECVEHWGAEKPFDSLSDYMMERTMPEMTEVNKQLERGFELDNRREASSKHKGLGRHGGDIHPVTLRFRDKKLEKEYESLRDSSFKFYIVCAFVIFLFMVAVQILILAKHPVIYGTMVAIGLSFLLLIVFTTGLKCLPFYAVFPTACTRRLRVVTELLISNKWCKVAMSAVSCALIFVASILPPMIDCQSPNDELRVGPALPVTVSPAFTLPNLSSIDFNSTLFTLFPDVTVVLPTLDPNDTSVRQIDEFISCGDDRRCCLFAPYYLFSCMLALVSCSVFLRIPYVIKSVYMVIGLIVFNFMFYGVFNDILRLYDKLIELEFLQTNLRGTLYTGVLCVTLIVLDRQIGSNLRLDFLCKVRIQHEKDEVQRNEEVNQILMDNILPRHVAEHFTRTARPKHAMYHERCTDTCVMFAAIPNFNMKTFFSSVDVTGKESLRLLNEIISAFDLMLMSKQFLGVEKIKTIGSTYMAAAGLHDRYLDDSVDRASSHVVLMVRFAVAMMRKLKPISEDAFGNYQLRIGINHGDVVAGVVGATKPQYDIWGDVVNVASRMESHGVIGKIQVPESTALILIKNGFRCENRGSFQIKGKAEPMNLYLVEEGRVSFERLISTMSTDSAYGYL